MFEIMVKNKKNDIPETSSSKGEVIVYQAEDGKMKLDVRLENETVWLTQQMMADLFQTTKQNIGQHLKNIFEEGELDQNSVVKNFFTTATDGKNYSTYFYNLDVIISVGYRVKSKQGTQFRIWANRVLKDYLVQGYPPDMQLIAAGGGVAQAALRELFQFPINRALS